jgi:transcriptional regulator with XRE-family HTH domain
MANVLVGAEIRKVCEACQLTLKGLGARTGKSIDYLSWIECGEAQFAYQRH